MSLVGNFGSFLKPHGPIFSRQFDHMFDNSVAVIRSSLTRTPHTLWNVFNRWGHQFYTTLGTNLKPILPFF